MVTNICTDRSRPTAPRLPTVRQDNIVRHLSLCKWNHFVVANRDVTKSRYTNKKYHMDCGLWPPTTSFMNQ